MNIRVLLDSAVLLLPTSGNRSCHCFWRKNCLPIKEKLFEQKLTQENLFRGYFATKVRYPTLLSHITPESGSVLPRVSGHFPLFCKLKHLCRQKIAGKFSPVDKLTIFVTRRTLRRFSNEEDFDFGCDCDILLGQGQNLKKIMLPSALNQELSVITNT